jgi:hypothetical protein
VPPLLFLFQAVASLLGELIEARAASRFRHAPFGLQQPCFGHAVQSRIERTFLDAQHVARGLLNKSGNGIAVESATAKSLENQEFQ